MKPLVQVPLKYGIIAGFLGAALVFGLYAIDRHPFLIPVFFDFRIYLFGVFIFFTLKELRDFHYGGFLYFWEGLIASFIFTAAFAIIAAGCIGMLILAFPGFLQSYITQSVEQLKLLPPHVIESIGKDTFDRNLAILPTTNAFDLALLYFTQSFMIGMFVSIILSVILRRQPKP